MDHEMDHMISYFISKINRHHTIGNEYVFD